MASVRVIIVNFNAGQALSACVEAVLNNGNDHDLSVVVVDNNSADDSMVKLESRFSGDHRLRTHYNRENLGFGTAVNKMAGDADEDYLLVLNPDCILQEGALKALIDALENDQEAAIAGPWVTDSQGRVQSGTWRRLPDPWTSLKSLSGLARLSGRVPAMSGINEPADEPPATTIRAEAVSGACMLWRRPVVEQLGYFDEEYTMHCEDLDLMQRLGQAGFHCLLVPRARAVHSGGLSSSSRPWWVHRQKHKGMQRYFRKFQAKDHSVFSRWLIYTGIWTHYLLTLPVVLLGRIKRSA